MPDEKQPDLSKLSDEELQALGQEVGVEIERTSGIRYVNEDGTPEEPAELMRGSSLEEVPPEPAELGFEPGNLYRGLSIVAERVSRDPAHDYLFDPKTAPGGYVRAFYVSSPKGEVGLVPWAGSMVVWPWDAAWAQDLYHDDSKKLIREAFVKAQGKKT